MWLKGEKINLRPVELSDIEELMNINDEDVRRNLLSVFPLNRLKEEEWIKNLYRDEHSFVFAIVSLEREMLIGTCGLERINWVNRSAEFGIAITDKSFWNMGYGTEATKIMLRYGFELLNLHRISLYVYDYNSRAIHVYEKCGFVREGLLREARFLEDKYHDIIIMSILQNEYEGSK
jgi:RimJ/RimL family protein N-acetyltransferase